MTSWRRYVLYREPSIVVVELTSNEYQQLLDHRDVDADTAYSVLDVEQRTSV